MGILEIGMEQVNLDLEINREGVVLNPIANHKYFVLSNYFHIISHIQHHTTTSYGIIRQQTQDMDEWNGCMHAKENKTR